MTQPHSRWVGHFFRTIDLDNERGFVWPEYQARGSWTDETTLKPMYMLRHAIRIGRLYATWAVRNGRRTVVGERPVVSFAELNACALGMVASAQNESSSKPARYAIVLPTEIVARIGGTPTIPIDLNRHSGWGLPIFDASEQYRIPALEEDETGASNIREWRWPLSERQWTRSGPFDVPATSFDIKGLNLDDRFLRRNLGVVVTRQHEKKPILDDILTKVDRGDIAMDHFKFVACYSDFRDRTKKTDPEEAVAEVIAKSMVSLDPFFHTPAITAKRLLREFDDLTRHVASVAPPPEAGEVGGCWLWLLDNGHPLVRALIRAGAVTVNGDGKYLARLRGWQSYSLRQRELMTKELSRQLEAAHRVKCSYFSVFNSTDPDAQPTYSDVQDHELYFNR